MSGTAIRTGTVAMGKSAGTPTVDAEDTRSDVSLATTLLDRFLGQSTTNFRTGEALGAPDDFYTIEIPFTLLEMHQLHTDEEQTQRAMDLLAEAARKHLPVLRGNDALAYAAMARGRMEGADTSYLLLGISAAAVDNANIDPGKAGGVFRNMLKLHREDILQDLRNMARVSGRGESPVAGRA